MPGIAWEQPRVSCIIEFAKLVAGDTVEEHCALQKIIPLADSTDCKVGYIR